MINRRFNIKKKLGEGRSRVFLCEDAAQLGRLVALKVLPTSCSEEEKIIFKKEYETIIKLNHTNIIRAYERGTVVEVTNQEPVDVGSKYILMEYFDGNELLNYKVVDEANLIEIITQICSVLFYLHQSNYIYYDLKAENILAAEYDGKPLIKLIDLGFAKHKSKQDEPTILGTAEYIAPELLKKEPHDHRVDLYSLGILLYRIIYDEFPFDTSDQLEIYKDHVGKEFIFPQSRFSELLTSVVKKLLNKNPDERYFNSIQVLYDLGIQIKEKLYSEWLPVSNFSDRKDVLNIIHNYISSPSEGEVIIIRGFERSGKSSVVQEIYARYENAIYIPNDRTKSSTAFIKYFIDKLIFNEISFPRLDNSLLALLDKIFYSKSDNLTNDLKILINKISQNNRFILLIDDFNLYDSFAIEIFSELFPLLQVNGCNIILTEKSDLDYAADFIHNFETIDLGTFTSVQVEELLERTYADFIPVKKITDLVIRYADFLPGNIIDFLKHIVLLRVIRFERDEIKIILDDNTEKILSNIYEEIYNIRYSLLNEEERSVALLLSSFESNPNENISISLSGYSRDKFVQILKELQIKHILHSQSQTAISFTSDGLKNFIYSHLPDKRAFHKKIADKIKSTFPEFNKVELARHYEICECYEECYLLLLNEAEEAEKLSAYKYARNILERLIQLPLSTKQKLNVRIKLTKLCDILNDFKQTFELSTSLINEDLPQETKKSISFIHANALIRMGEIEKGKDLLNSLLLTETNEQTKIRLMLAIAGAELDMNNFERAYQICEDIIKNNSAGNEQKGDAYNLLGIIDFQLKNNLDSALKNFSKCLKEYQAAEVNQRVAAVEINIGNIFNIKGEFNTVEHHWNRSLEISSSAGNLYLQGKVLFNLGAFHFHKLNFEEAINNYNKAKLIFNSLGDTIDSGLLESNIGETYLYIDDFLNALSAFYEARTIFHNTQNVLEESEVLFLSAKLYYKIGDNQTANELILELEEKLSHNNLPDRVQVHITLLKALRDLTNNNPINDESIIHAAQKYLEGQEKLNYFECIIILVKHFLNLSNYQEAHKLLTNKDLMEICESNKYMEAERIYHLGKIAKVIEIKEYNEPFSYFEKAINLVNELTVTELAWKILLEISIYYFERGIFSKAHQSANYGRSLIHYFGEKLPIGPERDLFYNKPERKIAWEKFTEILNQH